MSDILGININVNNKKEGAEMIDVALKGDIQKVLFTPNPEIIMSSKKNAGIADILNSADINLPDGVGILIASRILKEDITERVTGIDTAEYILSKSAEIGLRVFLLGAKQGVAEKARTILEYRYKGLMICGTHHGYFEKSGAENQKIINAIKKAEADVLFVCLGSPMQEKWISENKRLLPKVKLIVGLGGCLDVWSENLKRAPRIFRRLYLEWLWRILIEPVRIKRMPGVFGFIITVVREKIKNMAKEITNTGKY